MSGKSSSDVFDFFLVQIFMTTFALQIDQARSALLAQQTRRFGADWLESEQLVLPDFMLVLAFLADVYACSTCKLLSRRENLDISSCSRSTWWPEGSHPAQTSKRAKGLGWHSHTVGNKFLCQVVNSLSKNVASNLLNSHANSTFPGEFSGFFLGGPYCHNVETYQFCGIRVIQEVKESETFGEAAHNPSWMLGGSSAVPGAIIAKPKHKGRGLSKGVSMLDCLLFLMPSSLSITYYMNYY